MQPAKPAQFLVPERLDTETQSIGAGGAKLSSVDGCRRLWVGFQGDFGVGRHGEAVAAGTDDGGNFRRLEQRRRAAAKEDGVGLDVGIGEAADIGDQRIDVALPQAVVVKTAIEIAVITDRRAKRHVEVNADR